ncbi:putative bifunctional diguanylate cyclase/phosphodiesterase [Lichenicoccus sp.]|uniref:putative bifunctional diguanylate cyclase/phosphodiesterase n=1 Tax=Lichenicoccus sp. TaxID=2781899 RepID=UPI003D13D149
MTHGFVPTRRIDALRTPPARPSGDPSLARSQLKALSKQLPVLYGILIANTALLAATHLRCAPILLTVIIPSIACAGCVGRIVVWLLRSIDGVSEGQALRQLRGTVWLTAVLGAVFTGWSLSLFPYGDSYAQFHVAFYMAITVISCIFCLMHVRNAALLLTAVVIIPYVIFFGLTGNPVFMAMAINLLLVTAGMVFMLLRNYADFTALIMSQRALLVRQAETERLSDDNFILANLDSLTGLPNRRRFLADLDRVLAQAERTGTRFAVALFDLDGFKAVNDVHGHARGDQLLAEVGQRLRSIAGSCVLMARLGGDEFGTILLGNPTEADIMAFGERLCGLLQGPYLSPDIMAEVSGSAGLVSYPDGGMTAQQLFERADYALYNSKQTRCGGAVIFSHEHETRIRENSRIEQALRHANLGDEMWLAFQPIHDVRSQRTIGFEALARWRSPTLGIVGPQVFIPIAEQAQQIGRLTEILLAKALQAAAAWPAPLCVCFNLSALDLGSPATMAAVRRIIGESRIAASRIEFEVTETAVMRDFEQAAQALQTLRSLGARIALDDFGTGFSSLSHVHRLKPDKIKIDRSFIVDVETSPASRGIVRTIADMCRNLGLDCVAEGVETQAQLRILRALGCHLIQGYLFGRPMSDAAVGQHVAGHHRLLGIAAHEA